MEQKIDSFNLNFKVFWQILIKEKWLIIFISSIILIGGVFYSFTIKEEFKSEGKILPEVQSKAGSIGQFAGLAALAGVDIAGASGGGDAIRPDLYPDVLKSTQFFLSLFDAKFKDKKNNSIAFKDFYQNSILDGNLLDKDQKLNFPQSKNYIVFNRQTEKDIKDLKQRIVCTYDKKTGVISITSKMPDPVIAAEVTNFSMNYLTEYMIKYRTKKLSRDVAFLEERLSSAKGKYYSNQNSKAKYSDQIPLSSLRMQSADLNRERIESEYRISATFYNSLLQKLEEAKLKMQQETPVIEILEPAVVSNIKSEPKKSLIVLAFGMFGGLISFIVILIKDKNYLKITLVE